MPTAFAALQPKGYSCITAEGLQLHSHAYGVGSVAAEWLQLHYS